mmetsp:Transcript_44998/g.75669  ORF Transcript_44998/g.75669 Transcript_44998/m.75669 type:complete len:270 (+) Transcript_44998:5563-6372(+)
MLAHPPAQRDLGPLRHGPRVRLGDDAKGDRGVPGAVDPGWGAQLQYAGGHPGVRNGERGGVDVPVLVVPGAARAQGHGFVAVLDVAGDGDGSVEATERGVHGHRDDHAVRVRAEVDLQVQPGGARVLGETLKDAIGVVPLDVALDVDLFARTVEGAVCEQVPVDQPGNSGMGDVQLREGELARVRDHHLHTPRERRGDHGQPRAVRCRALPADHSVRPPVVVRDLVHLHFRIRQALRGQQRGHPHRHLPRGSHSGHPKRGPGKEPAVVV